MPVGFAHNIGRIPLTRASIRVALASLMIVAGARSVQDATADGQTRTLSFHHSHSGEKLTVTFKRNGRYDEGALKQLNHFLRDWRSQEQTTMDRRLFDILWEVYRDVDGKQPIQIISSYRSPATNSMLRRRSANSGVARFSQHTQGRAMDFFIPGVPLEKIRYAGLRLQRGGVGFYPTSGSPFVHLDTGSIRHWPRMTHDQLARVFPDGRTVHIPSDGKPLSGYQLAMAEIQRRGDGDSPSASSKTPNLLAALFGRKQQAEDDDEATPARAPVAVAAKSSPAGEKTAPVGLLASLEAKSDDPVPLPRAKPAAASRIQVASADTPPLPAARPAAQPVRAVAKAPQTPADIINARGFWDDMPTTPQQATPAQIAAINARRALGAIDPPTTATTNHAQALAYAPPVSIMDRAHIVAASAPIPRSVRAAATERHAMAVTKRTTVVAKSVHGQTGHVAISARIAAATQLNETWVRAMILAPSASTAMRVTTFGDRDMRTMAQHFVKPRVTVSVTFTDDDPQHGLSTQHFTGTAVAALPTEPFAVRTAWLR